jgi:hypothetical protein
VLVVHHVFVKFIIRIMYELSEEPHIYIYIVDQNG